jgi:endonuclease YncB( thermonuclease family)
VAAARRSVITLTKVVFLLPAAAEWSWGSDQRHTLYGRARLLEVYSPNVVTLKMVDRDEIVTVRLLGVGTPNNRDRVKDLNPEVLHFIRDNNLWEAYRNYVRSLLCGNVIEVRTRRWDRYDEKGRLLAYIAVPNFVYEPIDVNGEIIRKGFGLVTRDYVHVTFADYKNFEAEAKRDRRGLWAASRETRLSALSK